jgi:hypothetical protein
MQKHQSLLDELHPMFILIKLNNEIINENNTA